MSKKLLFFLSMILIASLSNSADLTCEWNGETCTISSITPVTQPNEAITIAGKLANYINSATIDLNFYKPGLNLNYFPTKVLYTFPFVNTFVMSSASPKTILETNSIVNCNFMNILLFVVMNISNIPEGFAQACTNINNLQFYSAGIDTIHKNAFKGLVNVTTLLIQKNRITCLPPDLFQTIPNVELVDLQHNRISAIDSGLFRNLPKVRYINLNNNSISVLPTLDFTSSCKAHPFSAFAIILSANPIYAIKPDFCNTFNARLNEVYEQIFYVPDTKCLTGDSTTAIIKKSNCQSSMAIPLQKCYANWTLLMNFPVQCEPCPLSSIWQQLLDFLNIKF
ncbi:hypothetical protein ACKWTF_003769 [Chironomus riparius]